MLACSLAGGTLIGAPLSTIHSHVAVLAVITGIERLPRAASSWLLPSDSMVAVLAHALGVKLCIFMFTRGDLPLLLGRYAVSLLV